MGRTSSSHRRARHPYRKQSSMAANVPAKQAQTKTHNSGSRWNRWEPHIHAPGTVLNNQFKGADSWERYLDALEKATPPIRALGITDYYSTETYERVVEAKRTGRLGGCELIFPNVEMRLAVGTVR